MKHQAENLQFFVQNTHPLPKLYLTKYSYIINPHKIWNWTPIKNSPQIFRGLKQLMIISAINIIPYPWFLNNAESLYFLRSSCFVSICSKSLLLTQKTLPWCQKQKIKACWHNFLRCSCVKSLKQSIFDTVFLIFCVNFKILRQIDTRLIKKTVSISSEKTELTQTWTLLCQKSKKY